MPRVALLVTRQSGTTAELLARLAGLEAVSDQTSIIPQAWTATLPAGVSPAFHTWKVLESLKQGQQLGTEHILITVYTSHLVRPGRLEETEA